MRAILTATTSGGTADPADVAKIAELEALAKAVATLEQRQAYLVGKIEEQNKSMAALKNDIYLRDQVDHIHTEKQEFLGGQLDAANKLLGKIQATSWGTCVYPDDVYNALRMLEQGRH